MSNPTFETGHLTREAGELVEKFHLVDSDAGKVKHAAGESVPFGAVTESAAPEEEEKANVLAHGLPKYVRVHTGRVVVPLATDDTGFTPDTKVFAAAEGKVAKTGTVGVGLAVAAEKDGLVKVSLFHPAGMGAA